MNSPTVDAPPVPHYPLGVKLPRDTAQKKLLRYSEEGAFCSKCHTATWHRVHYWQLTERSRQVESICNRCGKHTIHGEYKAEKDGDE